MLFPTLNRRPTQAIPTSRAKFSAQNSPAQMYGENNGMNRDFGGRGQGSSGGSLNI